MTNEIGIIEGCRVIETFHDAVNGKYRPATSRKVHLRVSQMYKADRGRTPKVPRKKQAQMASEWAQRSWNLGFRKWNRLEGVL